MDIQLIAVIASSAGSIATAVTFAARKIGQLEQSQKDMTETVNGCLSKIDEIDNKVGTLNTSTGIVAEGLKASHRDKEKASTNRSMLHKDVAELDKRVAVLESKEK